MRTSAVSACSRDSCHAAWHVLRRLRQRNRGATTTNGQLDTVRQRVCAAAGLLGWLRERGLTLVGCSQSDLDAVLARLLGIHIKVAVAWQHISAGDWTCYAADISRRHNAPVPVSPGNEP